MIHVIIVFDMVGLVLDLVVVLEHFFKVIWGNRLGDSSVDTTYHRLSRTR
jgi:hypothetical protein